MNTRDNKAATATTRLGKGMTVVAWLFFLGLLTAFFSSWLDRQHNPNQHVASHLLTDGIRKVVLHRNRYGHYVATGQINGHTVEFLVDTGATAVSIPALLAQEIGLQRGPALTTITANGTITTYATILDNIKLGDIVLYRVRANINPHSNPRLNEVLLGMSFLKQLEFTQRGDTLTLLQYP